MVSQVYVWLLILHARIHSLYISYNCLCIPHTSWLFYFESFLTMFNTFFVQICYSTFPLKIFFHFLWEKKNLDNRISVHHFLYDFCMFLFYSIRRGKDFRYFSNSNLSRPKFSGYSNGWLMPEGIKKPIANEYDPRR